MLKKVFAAITLFACLMALIACTFEDIDALRKSVEKKDAVKSFTVTFDKNNTDSGSTEANPQTKTVIYPAITVGSLPVPPQRTGYTTH